MDNKKTVGVWLVVCAILFLLGIGLGLLLIQQPNSKIQTADNLSSKVVSSIVAYGQVKNIDGRNITLSNLGDSLTISLTDNAQIYAFSTSASSATSVASSTGKSKSVAPVKSTTPVQRTAAFENIKVGDSVNVALRLGTDGQMQGTSLVILPVK